MDLINSHQIQENQITDIFVPIKKFTIEYINSLGKISHRTITEKVLSLYVFIKAKMSKTLFGIISNLPSCTALLISGDALSTVEDEQINMYREQCVINDTYYQGKKIIFKEDPYVNILAKPIVNNLSEREKILIHIYGNEKKINNYFDTIKEKELIKYRKYIFPQIYANEIIVQKYLSHNIDNSLLTKTGRIDFDNLNIAKLKTVARKYKLDFNSIDLNTLNFPKEDLEKLYLLLQKKKK